MFTHTQLKNPFFRCFTILGIVYLLLMLQSCSKETPRVRSKDTDNYDATFLTTYFDQLCKTIKNTQGFFPPQAARAYGYVGIASYEAVVPGIEGAVSLESQLNGFSAFDLPIPDPNVEYHWAIACNAATSKIMKYMFDKNLKPSDRKSIDSLETSFHQQMSENVANDIVTRSQNFGYDIAEKVFEYSKTDGGHEAYLEPFQLPYEMPLDEYCWVPTGAAKSPLSPKWGNNRPFLLNNITQTKVAMPITFSVEESSEFYKEAMVVYNQVKNNTAEQIEIAKYWADDPFATCTPAGHTFNILTQILKDEKASLAKASLGFVKMSIAENDAFIACWKGKYEHLLLRPVTYIQRYIDPNFKTVIGTPPFPAYTSGHSCEAGAAARIFTELFTKGSGDYQFTDYSQLRYGYYARSFKNFEEMAEECAKSRLYGGIHFPMDNNKGLQLGRAIGDNVNNQLRWPIFVR